MLIEKPTFKAIADHALLVSFSNDFSESVHSLVVALDNSIKSNPPIGLLETVPAIVNLLITFDPLITDHIIIQKSILDNMKSMKKNKFKGTKRDVHICYEESFSKDLETISKICGLSKDEFSPGYAYLSGVSDKINIPRKTSAIRDVDAGSVIIAGSQCLVTTLNMPTGWSIIGRSPTLILRNNIKKPFLFDVGDQVNFKRIDIATFEQLKKANQYV